MNDAELARAVTPGLLIVAFCGAWWPIRRAGAASPERHREARLALALAVTLVALLLLPLRVGEFSPWWLAWHLVPGAEGIRAIFRIELLAGAVAALLVVLALQGARERLASSRRGAWLVAAVAILLLFEQFNLLDVAEVDRRAEMAYLDAVPEAPPHCTSFVLGSLREAGRTGVAQQIDAMLLAQRLGIPTLGGYSGLVPPGWELPDPREPGFLARVERWSARNGIEGGVCLLDAGLGRWWLLPGTAAAS